MSTHTYTHIYMGVFVCVCIFSNSLSCCQNFAAPPAINSANIFSVWLVDAYMITVADGSWKAVCGQCLNGMRLTISTTGNPERFPTSELQKEQYTKCPKVVEGQ